MLGYERPEVVLYYRLDEGEEISQLEEIAREFPAGVRSRLGNQCLIVDFQTYKQFEVATENPRYVTACEMP